MSKTIAALLLLAGFAAGVSTAALWPRWTTVQAPDDWVARIGDSYLTRAEFIEEMRLRGGNMPGQYQDREQKRALLDTLLYQRALVQAAREEGLDEEPAVRRSRDQILANQYLQQTLRRKQSAVTVSAEDVRRFHEANAEQYALPARRRVAMLQIPVAANAGDEAWQRARALAEEAIEKTRGMNGAVPHFGAVAREYSHDSASRYRGGVIGWIAEGQAERYRYDPVLLEAAYAMTEPGEISDVLVGADGIYVARLVELESSRVRSLDELSAGIHQRLLRERVAQAEDAYRAELLARFKVEVREAALDAIDPLAPPAAPARREPPAMPSDEG